MSIAICLLMITSISASFTQNAGQSQNIGQPTSRSSGTGGLADSPWPMFRQNLNDNGNSLIDANAALQDPLSYLANWMVWIQSLNSDKDEYNVTETITVNAEVRRGNDMMTVVWDGSLILEVFNNAWILVYTEVKSVMLPHGGAVQYFSYNFNLNETGEYLIRETLYWADGTEIDLKEIEITIIEEEPQNQIPTANAGPDQIVNEGDVVQLDGSKSRGGGDWGTWDIQTVDSVDRVGWYTSIDVNSDDRPHISYYDGTNMDLKFAKWNGTNWSLETVDSIGNIGWHTSLAFDKNDNPHISYYDVWEQNLKYAKWTGSNWSIEIVDSDISTGRFTSLALDSNDYPHISYFYPSGPGLRYAKWNGSGWVLETVDSNHWAIGRYSSIALDEDDYPHISYADEYNISLKYAKWTGSDWSIEILDTLNYTLIHTSLALDTEGNPHISYYSNGILNYTRWTGTDWNYEIADSDGWVGMYSSIDLDSNNNPHISHCDRGNFDLKYTKRTKSGWHTTVLDSSGYVGRSTSIVVDSGDNPHISYVDETNDDLKYATYINGGAQIISYEWDFDSDGVYDYQETPCNAPDGAFDGKTTHIYGDDGVFVATLRVTDNDNLSATDTCNVTVQNVDPTVTIESITMNVEIGLRVAGRKYNNVSMTLYEDGNSIGNVSIERMPGSPDEQMAWIPVSINFSKSYSAIVTYTPEDPPNVGGNPVWIYIKSQNGSIKKIHHTFNVQQSKKRDSDHWNHVEPWEVDLNAHFIGLSFEITAHITDPGSDDETMTLTYGSQVKTVTYLNDPPNPDMYPSPEVNPRDIMYMTTLVYEGPGTVILVVKDDDNNRLGVGEGVDYFSVG